MDTAHDQRRSHTGLRLALLAFAQFIIAVDYNIVYVALPNIGRSLGFSTHSLQWVVSAYAVTFGGFLLLGGRAADRLGPRRMFLVALAVYGIASLAGGLAPTPGVLIAARAIQGLGGALLFPANLALITTNFTEGTQRHRAMAVWGATGSAGLAAGALLGGVLTSCLGWQWVLFIMAPLAAAALLAGLVLIATDPPRKRGAGGFDLPGALLATIGASLLVFGLTSGPEFGWGSIHGAGALTSGALLLGAFVFVERRTRNPLAPLRLFGKQSLATAMGVTFLHMGALGGTYYVFTTYVQNVLGYNALLAGLAFLPLGLSSILGGGKVAAALLNKRGNRFALTTGMIIYTIGIAALALGLAPHGSYWAALPGVAILGFGGGIAFTSMFVTAGSGVAPGEQGVAAALASTAQQIGAAVGLAVIVIVASTMLTNDAANVIPIGVNGLQTAMWVAAAFTTVGAILAATLKQRPHAVNITTAQQPQNAIKDSANEDVHQVNNYH